MKIALFANTDWYLYGFRLDLAKRLQAMGNEVHLIYPAGPYHQELVREGFICWTINLSRKGTNPITELRSLFQTIGLYRKEKFDVSHHFTIKPVIYGSLAAKLNGVRKVINSITGLGYVFNVQSFLTRIIRPIAIALYRLALKDTTVIFQNTEDQDRFTSQKLIRQEQGVVIKGSGVDTDKFHYKPEPPEPLPTVTLVGRLLWEKGVGEFIEAAKAINTPKKQAHFQLVGDVDSGNPGSLAKKQIESWQAQGLVDWMGWQREMPEVYSKSHIVCLPSYSEGLPKVLLEAAASGRPAVTTDIPGCRDVIGHNANGLLVPVKDVPALVQALTLLIHDPALRAQYGKEGRQRVLQHFSLNEVNRQTINLYVN